MISISGKKHDENSKAYFTISVFCPVCKKNVELPHRFSIGELNQLTRYIDGIGSYIQENLDFLSADEREQLISGICPECYNRIFGY